MGFSRQEYWSGLPFPSPGDLPNPGIEPGSPALQAYSLLSELTGFENQVSKQSCLVRLVAICSELKPKTADSYSTALSILPCGLLQDHLEGK